MIIKTAEFVKSASEVSKCPAAVKPEFAFIGRSNVGKSSLINMLVNNKGMAKTSGTPGKTQLINHFIVNGKWYLVDLPGYGFARTSQTNRAQWERMINDYLLKRENLQCVFVLIDSRIEPQKKDINFLTWLGENNIPFVIAFTKADKQTQNKTQMNVAAFKREMLLTWEMLPQMFITSAETKTGREELLKFIEEIVMNTTEKY